jgi:multiple sugar transport system ATP-binding protein
MAKIELKHLFKDYTPGVHAVTDFNLEIDDEEFIVLVGPSGCGKSTTLRMVAGLEDITSGELIIDGVVENKLHPKNRDIAMVFQNYALYPHMSVRENMAFGLKMKKTNAKEIESKVQKAAEILAIEAYLDRKPAELSGGQRQRVALGRAIVRDAKLFLMDEPLSNLDAKLRVQTRAEIIKLHKQLKTTTMYVTHDQTEAMTMATRIVVMKDGFIQQVGTPREIYLHPINYFVASFMGSPAMNFLKVTVEKEGLWIYDKPLSVPKAIITELIGAGYEGKEVQLGIRPEHILWLDDQTAERTGIHLKVEVELAELLGSETLVHFSINEQSMIAKIPTMADFAEKEMISVAFDAGKLHFFDCETEKRILFSNQEADEKQAALAGSVL